FPLPSVLPPLRPPRPTLFPYTTLFRSDEARLLFGRERTPDGLDQALARVGRREEDKHAALGARVEGGGTPGIDNHGIDVEVGQRSESTRLNSSHGSISYAVFCLKKTKR